MIFWLIIIGIIFGLKYIYNLGKKSGIKNNSNQNNAANQNNTQQYSHHSHSPEEALYEEEDPDPEEIPNFETKDEEIKYISGYKRKKFMSTREEQAYKLIQHVATQKGYTVFAQVRLLDLVEPKSYSEDNKAYLWKIQAKHVDYVICNKELEAKWVIELQDSTHTLPHRIKRDRLVQGILTSCNYKVLMTYDITYDIINGFLD